MRRQRAVLTGATGFLGLHVLPALLRAGFEVRILSRGGQAGGIPPAWDGLSYTVVRGDLANSQALAELVTGADLVVHAAGLIKALRRAEFMQVNQQGTARLAGITRQLAPAARFLLVSSLAAREPRLSGYAASKALGELAAEAAFALAPDQLAILRPPAIYGPWDKATLPLFQSTLRRVTAVPGRGRAAVMHVQDAADAIAALAANWRPGRFTLADSQPEGYRMQEMLRTAAKATGGTPMLLQMPDAAVLAAGVAAALWAQARRRALIFGPGKARELLHPDWSVHSGELLPAEIFTPRIGLAEGFAETVAWYRQAGWL